jgi:hypothetical protein
MEKPENSPCPIFWHKNCSVADIVAQNPTTRGEKEIMKKSNVVIAMFGVLIAAVSMSNARDMAGFDGSTSGAISVAQALAACGLDCLDIPAAPQAVLGNVKDICSKMSVSHANTIPVCVAGFLGEEAGATAIGVIQQEWDKQVLLQPDLALDLETIANGNNFMVKYDGKRLFLKKVSAPGRWVDGNPADEPSHDHQAVIPQNTVEGAITGGSGGSFGGAIIGAVIGFVHDVQDTVNGNAHIYTAHHHNPND